MSTPVTRRLQAFLAGERPDEIPFTTYFSKDRNMLRDPRWQPLFDQGLGVTFHVYPYEEVPRGVELVEDSWREQGALVTRQVQRTPVGEISATWTDGWQRKYWLETPADYRVMTWIVQHTDVVPRYEGFLAEEAALPPFVTALSIIRRTGGRGRVCGRRVCSGPPRGGDHSTDLVGRRGQGHGALQALALLAARVARRVSSSGRDTSARALSAAMPASTTPTRSAGARRSTSTSTPRRPPPHWPKPRPGRAGARHRPRSASAVRAARRGRPTTRATAPSGQGRRRAAASKRSRMGWPKPRSSRSERGHRLVRALRPAAPRRRPGRC